jgi:hypothetical protein
MNALVPTDSPWANNAIASIQAPLFISLQNIEKKFYIDLQFVEIIYNVLNLKRAICGPFLIALRTYFDCR